MLTPPYPTTTHQKNIHKLLTPSLNPCYKTTHHLLWGRECALLVSISHLLLPLPSDHFSIALLPFRHPHPQHYHYFLPSQALVSQAGGRTAFLIFLSYDMGPAVSGPPAAGPETPPATRVPRIDTFSVDGLKSTTNPV